MRNQLIKELKETSYWNLVFKEDTLIAYFGGSELIGYKDELSDFDIICITRNVPKQSEYDEFLMWNGKKVHFIYFWIEDFFNPNLQRLSVMTLTQLQALKENNTIFYNDATEVMKFLLNNSRELLKIGLYSFYNRAQRMVETIVNSKDFNIPKNKYLYHLIYAKKRHLNETITNEYLTRLKRIKWQNIDEVHIKECIKDIKELKEFMNNNAFDYESAAKKLKEKFLLEVNLK